MIRVLIADDQALIRESLKIVLDTKPNIQVVGTAADGQEALSQILSLEPDVVLMDVRMPKIDGVQCTKQVKEQKPQVKVIILTTFDDDAYISDAITYGASGYLLKGESIDETVAAIESVALGGVTMNSQVTQRLVQMYSNLAKEKPQEPPVQTLDVHITKTEWKIIAELEKGSSNKEISQNLHLSEGTVRNYLSSILSKLDLRDRTQVAIWALQHRNRGVQNGAL